MFFVMLTITSRQMCFGNWPKTIWQQSKKFAARNWSWPKTKSGTKIQISDFYGLQPCLICARSPADAHHLRFTQPRAMGLKVSDEFTVPLCRTHHRDIHSFGDEVAWWERRAIDPIATRMLWISTRQIE
jgi:hypothetical protein